MLVKSPPAAVKNTSAPAPAAYPGKVRPWPLSWLQAAAYLAFCILALEAVFALAHVGEAEYLMPDRVTGFTLMPNKVITQRVEGFGSFRTNSFGMQNDEITVAKPPGVLRIAVFGDSYVESLHVARDKNFLQTLARELGQRLHKQVQVLNFGVSNFSVAQDYLRYRTLAKRFQPDLAIQVFRVEESDKLLPQASSYLSLVRPVFFVGPHGELVYDDTNVRSFYNSSSGKNMVKNQWLRCNSRLWNVAGVLSQNIQTLKKSLTLKKAPAATSPAPSTTGGAGQQTASNKDRYLSCYWYMMDKQLESFRQECAANGTAFMILRTPMIKAELDQLRTNPTETNLLNATASRIGAPILNLDTPFKLEFGLKNDGSHFLSGGHFNRATHKWIGEHLADYLARNQDSLLQNRAVSQ
ncbi:MAG: SGNH/GDSL hydrolase family protein [Cyanobacteria bacterium SZAS LIN-3]|nr:SGNH/GDSL hydrolase family protein [Cyanobacteria bacterium SZAS LIN-3]